MLVVGILLLDIVKFNFGGGAWGKAFRLESIKWDQGAGVLGLVFALAFCPTSAGLFFGGLIPLALKSNSAILLPILYGIGTALPSSVFPAANLRRTPGWKLRSIN